MFGILLWSVRIKEIVITGSTRHTEENMVELLFPEPIDRNTLYCLYKEKFQPHKEITFVADYDVIFRSPFKVEVMVYEKSIVGYVAYLNSYMYFDKDGIIVESTSHKLEGIPQTGVWADCAGGTAPCRGYEYFYGDLKLDPGAVFV